MGQFLQRLVPAVALALAACMTSGEDRSRCPESECGPGGARGAFFPLAVGNVWTYTETREDSKAPPDTFDVRVTEWDSTGRAGAVPRAHGPSWTLGSDHLSLQDWERFWWASSEYALGGDTLFTFQDAAGDSDYFAPQYILPRGGDTLRYAFTLEGEVRLEAEAVRLAAPISVPAGTFSQCVEYRFLFGIFGASHRLVLCPGVGVVAVDMDGRAIRLVRYALER